MVDDVEDFDFEIDAKIVEGAFLKLNTRKATGPNNISGRRLKLCTYQLLSFLLYSVSFSRGL